MFSLKKPVKATPLQHVIDERADELRAISEELEDEAGKYFALRASIYSGGQRLEQIPTAIEDLDRERFRYLAKMEMDRSLPDREQEYAKVRDGLVAEQATLQSKREASQELLRQMDKSMDKLRQRKAAHTREVWQAVYDSLAEEMKREFRDKFLELFAAAHQVTDGIHLAAVLDRILDEPASYEPAARCMIVDRLKARFDLPE